MEVVLEDVVETAKSAEPMPKKHTLVKWAFLALAVFALFNALGVVLTSVGSAIATWQETWTILNYYAVAAGMFLPVLFYLVEAVIWFLFFMLIGKEKESKGKQIIIFAVLLYAIKVVLPIVMPIFNDIVAGMFPYDIYQLFAPVLGSIAWSSGITNSFWRAIATLFSLAGYTIMLLGAIALGIPKLQKMRNFFANIWFLPVIFFVISMVVFPFLQFWFSEMLWSEYGYRGDFVAYYLHSHRLWLIAAMIRNGSILSAELMTFIAQILALIVEFIRVVSLYAFILVMALLGFMVFRTAKVQEEKEEVEGEATEAGFLNIAKLIFLSFITFGIFYMIRIARVTAYCNRDTESAIQGPGKKAWLCVILPFYVSYWAYDQARRLDRITASAGKKEEPLSIVCLVLGLCVPLVSLVLLQDRINMLCTMKKR